MKSKVVILAALALALMTGIAFADGEWIREKAVWLKGVVYSGSSKVQLTNSTGNLSTTSGAFSSTLNVTGASTLSGAATLGSNLNLTDAVSVVPTGSTVANATPLTHAVNAASGAVNTGAVLPAGTGGWFFFGNVGPTNLKLYAPSGGLMNGTGSNTPITVGIGKEYQCVSYSNLNYMCSGN